jgi:hypothetical protein
MNDHWAAPNGGYLRADADGCSLQNVTQLLARFALIAESGSSCLDQLRYHQAVQMYLFGTSSILGVRHGEAPTAVAARRDGTSPRWSSSRSSPARVLCDHRNHLALRRSRRDRRLGGSATSPK